MPYTLFRIYDHGKHVGQLRPPREDQMVPGISGLGGNTVLMVPGISGLGAVLGISGLGAVQGISGFGGFKYIRVGWVPGISGLGRFQVYQGLVGSR